MDDCVAKTTGVSLMTGSSPVMGKALLDTIDVIGFDADDTLWENAVYFLAVEKAFCTVMAPYLTSESVRSLLYKVEERNMPWYGYGVMAYTLSLVEAAIEGSNGQIPAADILRLLELGRGMLQQPVALLPGVLTVLPQVAAMKRLVVVTKGDLLDQERKLKASGLLPYFHHIEIVTEKKVSNYRRLLETLSIRPEAFLMVGNSLRSDILPVLSLGGHAIHIPQPGVWAHEQADIPASDYVTLASMADLPATLGME
jgi:putative hydrolase of the HAD superfamily